MVVACPPRSSSVSAKWWARCLFPLNDEDSLSKSLASPSVHVSGPGATVPQVVARVIHLTMSSQNALWHILMNQNWWLCVICSMGLTGWSNIWPVTLRAQRDDKMQVDESDSFDWEQWNRHQCIWINLNWWLHVQTLLCWTFQQMWSEATFDPPPSHHEGSRRWQKAICGESDLCGHNTHQNIFVNPRSLLCDSTFVNWTHQEMWSEATSGQPHSHSR